MPKFVRDRLCQVGQDVKSIPVGAAFRLLYSRTNHRCHSGGARISVFVLEAGVHLREIRSSTTGMLAPAIAVGRGTNLLHAAIKSPVTPFGTRGVFGVVHGGQTPVSRAGVQAWQGGTPDYFLSRPVLETGATTDSVECVPAAIGGTSSQKVLANLDKPAPLESATSPTRGAAVTASSNRSCRSFIQ